MISLWAEDKLRAKTKHNYTKEADINLPAEEIPAKAGHTGQAISPPQGMYMEPVMHRENMHSPQTKSANSKRQSF